MNARLTDSPGSSQSARLDFRRRLRERFQYDPPIPHLPDYHYLQLAVLLAGARLFQPRS